MIFNVLPILVFIPFAFKVVAAYYSGTLAFFWLMLMMIVILNNSFLLHYLKRLFIDKPLYIGVLAILIASIAVLDKFDIFSLSAYSSHFFTFLSHNPPYIIILLAILVLVYSINYTYMKSRMTLEDVNVKKQKKPDSLSKMRYLESFGDLGEMIL